MPTYSKFDDKYTPLFSFSPLSLSLVFYTNFAKLVFHPYHIPCSLSCLSARTHTYSLTQSPLTKHSIYLNIFSLSIYFNVNAINNFPSSSLSPCHSVSVSVFPTLPYFTPLSLSLSLSLYFFRLTLGGILLNVRFILPIYLSINISISLSHWHTRIYYLFISKSFHFPFPYEQLGFYVTLYIHRISLYLSN